MLRDHGLPVDWNGDTGTRIRVLVTWRRRRTRRLAAFPPIVDDDVEDVLRRMPVRTDAWMSCLGRSGGIVQMR